MFIIVITNEIWKDSSQLLLNFLICLLACTGAADCIKLLVEFIYRYTLVCKQYEIKLKKLVLMGIGIYLCAIANTVLYFLTLSKDPFIEFPELKNKLEYLNDKFVVANTVIFF